MKTPSRYGAKLKELRRACGLTQSELARRAGIARQQIGLVERGERSYMGIKSTIQLSKILGVPSSVLFECVDIEGDDASQT